MIIGIISIYLIIVGLVLLLHSKKQYNFVKKEISKHKTSTIKDKEKLGKIGEFEVFSVLSALPKDDYIIINDLLYLNNNKTHQIDHVVVSNYGIFIIETKNYSGRVYGSDNHNTWVQYLSNKKYYFLNPVLQNEGHVKALENKIPEYKDYFVPIVCFTNKSVIKVKTKNYVIQTKNLLDIIRNYKTDVLIPDIKIVAQNLRNLSIDMPGAIEHHSNTINKKL